MFVGFVQWHAFCNVCSKNSRDGIPRTDRVYYIRQLRDFVLVMFAVVTKEVGGILSVSDGNPLECVSRK